jgi:hypothetical protein
MASLRFPFSAVENLCATACAKDRGALTLAAETAGEQGRQQRQFAAEKTEDF